MDQIEDKINFLKDSFPKKLRHISPETPAIFGKMNPQQMAEHMAHYIRLGYGQPIVNEQCYTQTSLESMRAFLMSDKAFRPNTPNPLMSDQPSETILADYTSAILDVENAVEELILAFTTKPDLVVHNPFFGPLNFEMTLQLLCKHAQHHLNQFGA